MTEFLQSIYSPEKLFKGFYLFIFRERKGRRKRGRETSVCGCLSHTLTGDLARNPGMCPDWESNQRPFGWQAGAQSTEPYQPGSREKNYFKDFIYLFLERGEEREKSIMCGCLLCTFNWGAGPQPKHAPWLGTELPILWFTGRHSIHQAIPVTAPENFLKIDFRERGRKRKREKLTWERIVNWLPPKCTSTGDWTHNLLVYERTLQPT